MARYHGIRDIPRVWEVDWAIPEAEGGTLWEAYDWALETAHKLGVDVVTVLGSTYEVLGRLDRAIGSTEASRLRVQPHGYRASGITVRGVTRRGRGTIRGVALVAWANDKALAEVESQRPAAIAAVADWPDSIRTWLSIYSPERIGQVRETEEVEFAAEPISPLHPRALDAFNSVAALVNENHSVLSLHEREWVAGALVALRAANVPVDRDALREHLMRAGWSGRLIEQTITLAERVARGETPRHRPFPL